MKKGENLRMSEETQENERYKGGEDMIKNIRKIGFVTLLVFIFTTCNVFAATTQTQNLKLNLTDPFSLTDMNNNFTTIDSDLAKRAVSPDYFKVGTGTDDTEAVQAAFDSGNPVIFTRNYNVRSVSISGARKTIDFNRYWLLGTSQSTDSDDDKDSILKITGTYHNLYNVAINGNFNSNYKCAVHWYSPSSSQPAQHITVHDMLIVRSLVGLQFGSYLDNPNPVDAPQSENVIYGLRTRSIQNCIILNQPNGFLRIIGSELNCNEFEWAIPQENPGPNLYSATDAYAFYNKETELTIESSELEKTATSEGYGFKGEHFVLSNCTIEVGSTWGYITGDAYINQSDGGFQGGSNSSLFEIAPNASGRLMLDRFFSRRQVGVAATSSEYMINSLNNAPDFKVSIEKSKIGEWSDNRICSSNRGNVVIEDTRFSFTDTDSVLKYKVIDDKAYYINMAENVDTTGENMSTAQNTGSKSGWKMFVNSGTGTVYFCKNTADVPFDFNCSIEVKASSGNSYIYSPMFTVQGGKAMVFKGLAKYTAGDGSQGARIIWFNSSKAYIGQSTVIGLTDINTSSWTEVIKNITAPTNAAYAYIQILANNGSILVAGMQVYAQEGTQYHNSLINSINKALDTAGEGFILKSPNGTRYKVTVSDTGTLTSTALP